MSELKLESIERSPDIQPRAAMNLETITQYAEDMLAGIKFPPIVVFDDGEHYWLSQGFHRCMAAEQAGFKTVSAELRKGSHDDAIWDAAQSNREHDASGLRRTNGDKRRAIILALKAKPGTSERQIAKHVGCAPSWVHETIVQSRAQPEHLELDYREGIDGKIYPATKPLNGESTPDVIAAEIKPVARPTFNQTNEMVDWARWTWNPVTGCEHTCVYCYARDIANRFYPEKFEPTFRPERLDAPRNTTFPAIAKDEIDPVNAMGWRNCFVCSMADLFGRWVPDEWIEAVFDSCRQSPQWNYLFLTKFPQRYVGLDFPETAWVGTTVDEQKRVANAEKAFAKIKAPVKWLSLEPLLEPLRFNDLSMFDWVVIGGQSRSSGAGEFFPPAWWVFDLAHAAREAGCKVYLKPNTFSGNGWQIKEYPYDAT